MSKLGVGLLLSAVLVLTPMWAAAAEFKVGIVNSPDIIFKSAAGKSAQDSIKRKTEELGKPLAQKEQDLQRQFQDYQKQASLMKEEARKQKEEELKKKAQEFERQGADAQKQMQKFQEQQFVPLKQKLDAAVKAVAQQEKLDMVLDVQGSGILFADPKLDITEKVRSKF